MTRILLAFDKFKGSISAREACQIAGGTLRSLSNHLDIVQKPLTDGGEGFCEILTEALGGKLHTCSVTGPAHKPLQALVGYVQLELVDEAFRLWARLPAEGCMAVLEMAQAAGHHSIQDNPRDLWNYTTKGVGELLCQVEQHGAHTVLMGMGGSATNDMGLGMLEALGYRGMDASGASISPLTPSLWMQVQNIKTPTRTPPLRLVIACDVNHPLHGENGCAAVFGPQKGLQPYDLPAMQHAMQHMEQLIQISFPDRAPDANLPGMGAAGGLPFGLNLAFDTHQVPGFELVDRALNLSHSIEQADVVMTGEGRLDKSSLSGKGPVSIALKANELGKKVHIFAGSISDEASVVLRERFNGIALHQVGTPGASVEENIRNEPDNLRSRVQEIFSHDLI